MGVKEFLLRIPMWIREGLLGCVLGFFLNLLSILANGIEGLYWMAFLSEFQRFLPFYYYVNHTGVSIRDLTFLGFNFYDLFQLVELFIFWFLMGMLIGFIIRKIKSKKQEEVVNQYGENRGI
jgi:hypothetical protein